MWPIRTLDLVVSESCFATDRKVSMRKVECLRVLNVTDGMNIPSGIGRISCLSNQVSVLPSVSDLSSSLP